MSECSCTRPRQIRHSVTLGHQSLVGSASHKESRDFPDREPLEGVPFQELQAVTSAAGEMKQLKRVTKCSIALATPFAADRKLRLRVRNTEVTADFPGKMVRDFIVSRDCGTPTIRRITPPRVIPAFTNQLTTVIRQMANQITSFHG